MKKGFSIIEVQFALLIFSLIMVISSNLLKISSQTASHFQSFYSMLNQIAQVRMKIENFNVQSDTSSADVMYSLNRLPLYQGIKQIEYNIVNQGQYSDLKIIKIIMHLNNGKVYQTQQYIY